jgi:hypothetical protein
VTDLTPKTLTQWLADLDHGGLRLWEMRDRFKVVLKALAAEREAERTCERIIRETFPDLPTDVNWVTAVRRALTAARAALDDKDKTLAAEKARAVKAEYLSSSLTLGQHDLADALAAEKARADKAEQERSEWIEKEAFAVGEWLRNENLAVRAEARAEAAEAAYAELEQENVRVTDLHRNQMHKAADAEAAYAALVARIDALAAEWEKNPLPVDYDVSKIRAEALRALTEKEQPKPDDCKECGSADTACDHLVERAGRNCCEACRATVGRTHQPKPLTEKEQDQ